MHNSFFFSISLLFALWLVELHADELALRKELSSMHAVVVEFDHEWDREESWKKIVIFLAVVLRLPEICWKIWKRFLVRFCDSQRSEVASLTAAFRGYFSWCLNKIKRKRVRRNCNELYLGIDIIFGMIIILNDYGENFFFRIFYRVQGYERLLLNTLFDIGWRKRDVYNRSIGFLEEIAGKVAFSQNLSGRS